jgi:prepilin-type N-terminal cleavage/methylation domain-containing protein
MRRVPRYHRGFTLLELLIATAIFMVICAAMFTLLQMAQQKYAVETQMSGSFSEARLGLDQIVRDINISGYPTANMFSNTAAVSSSSYAQAPFAWAPGYLTTPTPVDCQLGGTGGSGCNPSPSDFDLIVETNLAPNNPGSTVSWIRYKFVANSPGDPNNIGTLYRGVVAKSQNADPVATTNQAAVMTPLVNNVVNYAGGPLITQISAQYPLMFSTGTQPIFTYTCSTPTGPQPCASAGTYNAPRYVSDVDITLIVMTPQPDMQTQSIKLIELTGRGHRTNSGN